MDDQAARGFAAATAQIDLALREAQGPIEATGAALERMSEVLVRLREVESKARLLLPESAAAECADSLSKLQQELGRAVQGLQFHDRMFQHLSHVHDFLFGAADLLAATSGSWPAPAIEPEDAAAHWERLREQLSRRLLTDRQRQLLDVMLPPRHWRDEPAAPRGATNIPDPETAGDVELF